MHLITHSKKTLLALVVALALPVCAYAKAPHYQHHKIHGPSYYTNVDGKHVHRPAKSKVKPGNATAKCADGSFSFSQHHRGTCSRHGGVVSWYK